MKLNYNFIKKKKRREREKPDASKLATEVDDQAHGNAIL